MQVTWHGEEDTGVGMSGLSSLNYNCLMDAGRRDVLSSRANRGQLPGLSWWVYWVVGAARAALFSIWCVA